MTDRAPIVFLHGLGLDRRCWQGQQAALTAAGFRCYTWEMPGHGAAAWDGQPITFARLAAQLIGFLDAEAITAAHLIGHSMGGMLALEVAATTSARCRSLTLAGSAALFGSADGRFQQQFLAERLGPLDAGQRLADLAPALIADLCLPTTGAETIADCIDALAGMEEAAYRATLAALVTFDRRAALPALSLPTLCLAAEHDRQAPPQGVVRLASKIPGARFQCLDQAAHLVMLERPDAMTAALIGFIGPGS